MAQARYQERHRHANKPGGRLKPEDVVGRDREIARFWQILDRQSLVISAERWIGKTHILYKMQEECPDSYLPVYQDLEAVHSVGSLVRSIYAVADSRSFKARVAKWSDLLPSRIGGIQLPSAGTALRTFLPDAFDRLIELSGDRRILFLWDEFPLMLHNLQQHESARTAIQLLDYLRSLRLDRPDKLRFLFTGSIGLHLVLRSLHKSGNANAPVNDMMLETVPPLAEGDTRQLASELLKETGAAEEDIPDMAHRIAGEVGGFPYHVHHVVDRLGQLQGPPAPADVSPAVDRLVHDSQDPANFSYYVTRLDTYYSPDDRARALLVLDTLAGQQSLCSVPSLHNLCRHKDPSLPEEEFRNAITMLKEDHYIEARTFEAGTAYDFRWQLVKRWWRERLT
ncbi:MAG: ATP-binding protein [Boseongicola sp. SB0675_bin_26]|nr:ATP-binding protein [Boseongicola sp. SB0675_bin_26]